MNKFARDMLMAKYGRGDGRGYSSSDSGRYSSNDTMIREPRYSMPDDRFEHLERKRRKDIERDRNRDYGYDRNRDYNEKDYRSRDYAEYEHRESRPYDRGYDRDYNREYDRESREYDRDYNRDYGETQYGKMSRKDIEKWKHSLMNADGTKGEHFKKEMIEPSVKRLGIDVERMGGMEVFCLTVNMMYADYCKVAKKYGTNHIDFYVDMAKAFLEDKDFMGEPEEKLWLYYKCIAESEE